MTRWLVALDDTDVPGGRGTGQLARMLMQALVERGARGCGVTRHQLLVHPSVPYTSHNSANCLGLAADWPDPADVLAWVCSLVVEECPEGSDPGVCMAPASAVERAVVAFGRRTQREVVSQDAARRVAEASGCLLQGLGGTRDGVIGALAAVGLRAGGNDGRFVDLGGVRGLAGVVSASELIDAGVDAVLTGQGDAAGAGERVETLGWVRPRLREGRALLLVERSESDDAEWIVRDRRGWGSRAAMGLPPDGRDGPRH